MRTSVADQLASLTVLRLDQPIEWVETTAGRVPNGHVWPANLAVYVIQLRGRFSCPG